MSGIAGIARFDGQLVRAEEVNEMHNAMAHRGPDACGQWVSGSIGLAQRALHTTPEALHEHQPVRCTETGLTLVSDARIDNRQDLIRQLSPRRHTGSIITDADLVLASYKKWDVACPAHLIGAFAFAIWDERKQQLLLACDHMALRTLFFYRGTNFIAFGTEIKTLFHVDGVPRQTNEAVVADHLTTVARRDPHATFYRGISQLGAAHRLVISRDACDTERYWNLDPEYQLQLESEEDYVEAFRECFGEAVECRLRAPGSVGSTLSGGLDSSSIACTARDALREKGESILTFSCIFPSLPEKELQLIDERSFIKAVAETDNVKDHYVYADQSSPLVDIDRFLWHTDDGFWPGNMYLHWLMFGEAQKLGIRVFFDGSDGDSTVSHGKEYLRELIHLHSWNKLEDEIRAIAALKSVPAEQLARRFAYGELARHAKNCQLLAFRQTVKALNKRFNIPYREMLMGPGLRSVLPTAWRRKLDKLTGSSSKKSDAANSLIRPDFAASQGIQHRLEGRFISPTSTGADDSLNHRVAHAKGLTDHQFMRALNLGEKAGAAHQIEPRYPFFDRRLMEFCVAMPGHMKLNDGWDRYVMRKGMENTLPPEIQWRKDKGRLGANLARNFWSHEDEHVDEMLNAGRPVISSYVNMNALEELVKKCRAETDNRARLNGTMQIMAPYMLWRWMEKEHDHRQ